MLITARNSSCGKDMFSQACVIPSVHRADTPADTLWVDTPWADTPLTTEQTPRQKPPLADKPLANTHQRDGC